ncbi:nucleolar protein 9-like [Stylophora pistillata]|uniref:Nucleolar protein 9 n=1 Tax=Stylophora pistillata TaxID=50429 RepID=A0A2B4T2P1_STYPI|nr:nucleolar protein 9-like [Stylophora pistillata]PFX35048.1 Nucleolar protein 9 [Stylophora pistillata]
MKKKNSKKRAKVTSALDEQTSSYFKRVEDMINEDDFDDDESRKLFVENVFTQVENNEVKLSCDMMVSRTMEKLIVYFNDIQIRCVIQNIEDHFCKIAMDKFGSHVLQSLICVIPKAVRSERSKIREVEQNFDNLKSAEELFLSLCHCFQENLGELVSHTYGSHVLRTAFEVLGGVKVADSVVRSRASRQSREKSNQSEEKRRSIKQTQVGNAFGTDPIKHMETVAVPDSFPPILRQLTNMIIEMELQKLALHPVSNPLLQTLLLVLHRKDQSLCMKLCKAVMSQIDMYNSKKGRIKGPRESKEGDHEQASKEQERSYRVPVLLSNEISSHLVEKILHVVTPELWREIYDSYFNTHLVQLSCHPIANFIVQHLMASTTDKAQAKQILAELLPYLEDLLANEHMGIVVRMAEVAVQFLIKQKTMLKALLQAFHCEGKDEQSSAVLLFLSLTTYDIFYGTKPDERGEIEEGVITIAEESPPGAKLKSINFHGALLLKTLFDFQDPSKVVTSLLCLSMEELMTLATDSMGSYALEAFLKSRFVPSEKKHVLIEKLKGTFVRLACEKQGSHVVETCWRQAEVRYKEAITQELLFSEQQLNGNFYGRIVLRNCGVEHLKRKDKTWFEKEQKAVKKRKFLEEILEERQDIKHTKKVKLVEDGKSKNFGREMAALGFTASGENAVDSEEEDDADDAKGSVDAAFEKKPKKDQYANKNMQTEKKKKNRSSNETDKLAELEFIDSAIKATKSLKKSKKEEKKKK